MDSLSFPMMTMEYSNEQMQMLQKIVDYTASLSVGTVLAAMGIMEKPQV